jgi:hypothetical protein
MQDNESSYELTVRRIHPSLAEDFSYKSDNSVIVEPEVLNPELMLASNTIRGGQEGLSDERVLQLYIGRSFEMLEKILESEGSLPSTRGKSESSNGSSQHLVHQAIIKRRLVVDPVKALIGSGNLGLLREAIEADVVKLKKDEVKLLLVNRQTKMVLTCLKKVWHSSSSTHPLLKRFEVIAEVCKLFKDVELIPDAIHIFSMIHRNDIEAIHFEQLICFIGELIHPPKESSSSLAKAANPMGLCVILSDFLDSIKTFSRHLLLSIDEISKELVTVAEGINRVTTNLKELNCIFRDRPLGTHQLIELLVNKPRKYRAFLNSPLTKQIIIKYWTGDFTFSLGLDQCSYVATTADKIRKPSKLWKIHTKTLQQKTFSIFQFQSWIYNCNVRHFVETGVSLAFLCCLVYLILGYIDFMKVYRRHLSKTADDIESAIDTFDTLSKFSDRVFLPFMCIIGAQTVTKLTYKFKAQMLFIPDPREIFDIIIVIFAASLWSKSLGSYQEQADEGRSSYEYFWTGLTFCLSMRVFLCFSTDYQFGPLLRMFYATFVDIGRFLLIFVMILFVFSVSFHCLFYETPSYDSILNSTVTLISSTLGNFDFFAFVSRENEGLFLLAVWILISTILILNILIAFLSKRYEEMAPQTDADFVSLLFVFIQTTRFTPEYGGLVMFPLPFTLLLIPFIPLYFLPVDKRRLSAILAKLSYTPMFLFAVGCFAVHCAVRSLYSYFIVFWMLAADPRKVKTMKRLKSLAKWVFIGPFYLAFLSLASFPVLVRFLFAKGTPNSPSLFTENTLRTMQTAFQHKLELAPSQEEIPIEEALGLLDSSFIEAEISNKAKVLKGASILLRSVVPNPHERLSYGEQAWRGKELAACKCMVMKLASFSSQTLNLKEAVQILQDSPSSLQTYSRYITEQVLASLKDPSKTRASWDKPNIAS